MSIYFPYFRGKQYELITIRENAQRLAESEFVPVIEPVRDTFGGLAKCLDAVLDANGTAVVIVNPHHGNLASDGDRISALLRDRYLPRDEIAAGILLKERMGLDEAIECCNVHADHQLTLIHAGFLHGKSLADRLGDSRLTMRHIFVGENSRLYRRSFQGATRVAIKNGFERRKRNADHPELEFFSDLHATFKTEEAMDGFGDFLTVGDDFIEGGGPAYVVAIHLTFINREDEGMYIYHFKSENTETPTDPAGKFGQALAAMIAKLDEPNSNVLKSDAVSEFRSLHERGHFPGLGYVKKLSMQHHIETLADYFSP